jgi:hypothetical protein
VNIKARITFTPDSDFITIQVSHDGTASNTLIFNAAANCLNESRFSDWAMTKIEHTPNLSFFTCEK